MGLTGFNRARREKKIQESIVIEEKRPESKPLSEKENLVIYNSEEAELNELLRKLENKELRGKAVTKAKKKVEELKIKLGVE